MSREGALARAEALFDRGDFFDLLAQRVTYQTESQVEGRGSELKAYLVEAMAAYLEKLGFDWRLADNPVSPDKPFLIARRMEGEGLPTLLTYGHGDTVRAMEGEWARRAKALEARPGRSKMVRPGQRRQQGPAFSQPGRFGLRPEGKGLAGLQYQGDHRNGRGGRLARPARHLPHGS